jgi:hypothetical protein
MKMHHRYSGIDPSRRKCHPVSWGRQEIYQPAEDLAVETFWRIYKARSPQLRADTPGGSFLLRRGFLGPGLKNTCCDSSLILLKLQAEIPSLCPRRIMFFKEDESCPGLFV